MATAAYTNGYRQYSFADFSGGLNLRDKADTVGDGQAIDLLNVDFTDRGAITQRDGYVDFTAADLTNRVDSLSPFYKADGTAQLVAGCGTRLEALNQGGALLASKTGLLGGPWAFARFAAPGLEYLYCANGQDTLQRWDGVAWTAPTATVNGAAGGAMPKAGAIAVTATVPGDTSGSNANNRLIATAFGTQANAGPGGYATNPSRWFASNPGQPEVWETDGNITITPVRGYNFGDLTPGDGEQIMAAVTWRELVFIFKETKFFVLWGEGTSANNLPVFNFREVVNSVGLASPLAISVGRDGVYFMNRRGVYRTSGGNPELLSDVISPMWTQDPDVFFRSKPINLAQLGLARMLWHMERLYLAVPTGTATVNDRVLVYDTQHRWWTLYDLPASALASFRASALPSVFFGYSSGPQRVGQRLLGGQNDRGAVITSRWRSGWSDYGSSQVKTIREAKAWGRGAVTISFSGDYAKESRADLPLQFTPVGPAWDYATLTQRGGTYAALANAYTSYANLAANAGVDPIIDDAMARYATRAIVFSTQFANNSALAPSWAIHRVAKHMREVREPSVSS